jgi:hypothetical protein
MPKVASKETTEIRKVVKALEAKDFDGKTIAQIAGELQPTFKFSTLKGTALNARIVQLLNQHRKDLGLTRTRSSTPQTATVYLSSVDDAAVSFIKRCGSIEKAKAEIAKVETMIAFARQLDKELASQEQEAE